MTIRSLDLLDLPTIYRYRGEATSLDSARALTRGNPLGAIGLMAYMNPQRHVYSAICTDGGATMLGGVIHTNGESHARMLYLAPTSSVEHPELPGLIDSLSTEAGHWGAFHVLAELDESSPAFAPLRRTGFVVYTDQRMWDASALDSAEAGKPWPRARSVDSAGDPEPVSPDRAAACFSPWSPCRDGRPDTFAATGTRATQRVRAVSTAWCFFR